MSASSVHIGGGTEKLTSPGGTRDHVLKAPAEAIHEHGGRLDVHAILVWLLHEQFGSILLEVDNILFLCNLDELICQPLLKAVVELAILGREVVSLLLRDAKVLDILQLALHLEPVFKLLLHVCHLLLHG